MASHPTKRSPSNHLPRRKQPALQRAGSQPIGTTVQTAEAETFVRLEINLQTLKRLVVNHNLVMEDLRYLNAQTTQLVKRAMLENLELPG